MQNLSPLRLNSRELAGPPFVHDAAAIVRELDALRSRVDSAAKEQEQQSASMRILLDLVEACPSSQDVDGRFDGLSTAVSMAAASWKKAAADHFAEFRKHAAPAESLEIVRSDMVVFASRLDKAKGEQQRLFSSFQELSDTQTRATSRLQSSLAETAETVRALQQRKASATTERSTRSDTRVEKLTQSMAAMEEGQRLQQQLAAELSALGAEVEGARVLSGQRSQEAAECAAAVRGAKRDGQHVEARLEATFEPLAATVSLETGSFPLEAKLIVASPPR